MITLLLALQIFFVLILIIFPLHRLRCLPAFTWKVRRLWLWLVLPLTLLIFPQINFWLSTGLTLITLFLPHYMDFLSGKYRRIPRLNSTEQAHVALHEAVHFKNHHSFQRILVLGTILLALLLFIIHGYNFTGIYTVLAMAELIFFAAYPLFLYYCRTQEHNADKLAFSAFANGNSAFFSWENRPTTLEYLFLWAHPHRCN